MGLVALPVLIERDVEVGRLLLRLGLQQDRWHANHHSSGEDSETPEPMWRASNRLDN
jgi:hypothetical protein